MSIKILLLTLYPQFVSFNKLLGRILALEKGLKNIVAKAFAFSMVGNAGAKLLFTAAILVVIKVISKEQFGVANIVLAIFAITESINEMGLGVALVQKKEISKDQISALFWLSLLISFLLYPLLFFGAPLFSYFYEVQDLSPLIRVYGIVLIIYALNLVPRNLLVKDLEFKKLAIIDNIAMSAAATVMILMAYNNFGAWSIIFGDLTNRLFQLFGCFLAKPFIPALNFGFSKIKDMFYFGVYATGSRLLYNFYTHADYLIIGKVFGAEALGIYTLAYRLISDPVRTFAGIVNQVAYPTFSKLQNDIERLKKYFFTISRFSLLFTGSILVLIVVFIDWILNAGGYEKWLDAVPIAYIFAGVGIVRSISPLIPQLLNAAGQAKKNFIYSLCMSIGMPLGFFAASRISLFAVAWSWTIIYPFMVMILIFFGSSILKMSPLKFTVRFFSSLPILLVTGCVCFAIKFLLSKYYLQFPIATTVFSILFCALIIILIIFHREREVVMSLFAKRAK
jgi:O-antigen/teichoic acid export membrane protein